MLHFEDAWRFSSPGSIPNGVVHAFDVFISKIVVQGDRHGLLEHFKGHFAGAAGMPHHISSSAGWAETDLQRLIEQASANAPMFIEAFYNACEELRTQDPRMGLPDVDIINRVLNENAAGYEVQPPNLVATRRQSPISAPKRTRSLTDEAHEIIQHSWEASDRLLAEGRSRPAVQELLWLLETVTTAFRGMSSEDVTVQGTYFNKIVADLRSGDRGKRLDHILGLIVNLHGYLSATKGGGVRHGTDLKEGIAMLDNDARLYCNLIRSYITFLIHEHERLSASQTNTDRT
jgi:hypothetical protein